MNDINALYIMIAVMFIWLTLLTLWISNMSVTLAQVSFRLVKEISEIYDRMNVMLDLTRRELRSK